MGLITGCGVMAVELNDENFRKLTKQGNAVVDFYADWCGPCQMMKPVFEKVSKDVKGVNFFKLNVDNNPDTAAAYSVRSIPTLLFLKNNKEADRMLGVMSEEDFKKKISSAFK